MREWEQDVLEQYDIDVKSVKKVRGGILCEGEKGFFLLEETRLSEKRLAGIACLTEQLISEGFTEIDNIKRNKEGMLFSELEDGSRYIVKRWFNGRECDIKKENELLNATKNMTRLHKAMNNAVSVETRQGEDLQQVFFRHNREMKKVRTFIREKVDKGSFEDAFLKNFEAMFEWAECALDRLEASNYRTLQRKLIHGDYNYHNILILHDGMATTNFTHFEENIQAWDFYYFLRKAMEKNHWDVRLGDKMLDYYQRFIPFSADELEYISICIAYPEKFWKAANSYSRSKKAWIPAKNLEKLELVIKQSEEKQIFLKEVFNFRP